MATDESEFVAYGYGRLNQKDFDMRKRRACFEYYEGHVFLCCEVPESWSPDFNKLDATDDTLPAKLFSAFKDRKDEISPKTMLTVCGGCPASGIVDGDVLIFPDMVKYSLKAPDVHVDSFVEQVLVKGEPSWPKQDLESGAYVFVCAHGNHDRRDGVCGGLVMEKMLELVNINKFKDIVFPMPCSDLGPPEFAAT